MLSLFARYRELVVVAALLVYPFAGFLAHGSSDREPNILDRVILAVTSPPQKAICWVVEGMGGGWRGYVALQGTAKENAALKDENAELRNQVQSFNEASLENARLRRLLGFAEGQLPKIPARIIAVNDAATVLSVRIVGDTADLRPRFPVVTPDGVVGQVLGASGKYADVLLITDVRSRIGVRVQRSRARGTASGSGGARSLKLTHEGALLMENVLRTEDLADGDRVVTSGTDGIFPPGLVVGRAVSVKHNPTGMFLYAEILPAVDLNKVDEVLVLDTSSLLQGRVGVPP
jgi:rod shape-determining protein MreC